MTKLRTILILVGIFLAGVASGALLLWGLGPQHDRKPPGTRDIMAGTFDRISRDLGLTAAQREKVDALMREMNEDFARTRQSLWRSGLERMQKLNADIEALLTPEQRAKFEQIRREQAERMERRQKERERRYGGPPHGEHPPGEMPMPGGPPPPEPPGGDMPPPPPPPRD